MNRPASGFLLTLAFALALCGCTPKPETSATPTPEPQSSEVASERPAAPPATAPTAAPALAKPAAAAPSLKTIRIVAWNLEWFPGHKPNATPDAEAEQMKGAKTALAELKPDVLMLEEIRDWENAAELCKAVPELQVHVVSAFQPRPQNQVVASRFAADSTWSEAWQTGAISPPRGYSFAAIELPGPKFLLTYALHLKSNVGEFAADVAMRQEGTKQVLRHVQEMLAIYSKRGPCAVVLGGDMNSSLDDPKFSQDKSLAALIKAGFHWTHEGVPFAERTTIPGKGAFSDNCFDHIFTLGLGKPVASVKPYAGISDHNPVVLEVDLALADFKPVLDVKAGEALIDEAKAMGAAAAPTAVTGVLDASDTPAIVAAVGRTATIKGRVKRVASTKTNNIYFIDFEGVARGGFTGVVKQANLPAITAKLGSELEPALSGKTIELKGVIATYKDAPQIIITSPEQIKVLP